MSENASMQPDNQELQRVREELGESIERIAESVDVKTRALDKVEVVRADATDLLGSLAGGRSRAAIFAGGALVGGFIAVRATRR